MEEKEPFKIKFTTVLIIVFILFIIIGILSYNLNRLNTILHTTSGATQNSRNVTGLNPAVPSPNDYEFYNENYKTALETILSNSEETDEFGELQIQKIAPDSDIIGISSITIDHLFDAYINIPQNSPLYSKYGKIYKIASNVIDVEFCHVGNGDSYKVFFINNDGTVSELISSDIDENGVTYSGELSTQIVNNLSNIIRIFSIPVTNAEEAAFVDINGNIFDQHGEAFE